MCVCAAFFTIVTFVVQETVELREKDLEIVLYEYRFTRCRKLEKGEGDRKMGGGKFSPRPVCFGVDTLTLFSALPAISAQPKTTHKQQ